MPPALLVAVADGLQGPSTAKMCRVYVGRWPNKKRPVGSDIAGNLSDVPEMLHLKTAVSKTSHVKYSCMFCAPSACCSSDRAGKSIGTPKRD